MTKPATKRKQAEPADVLWFALLAAALVLLLSGRTKALSFGAMVPMAGGYASLCQSGWQLFFASRTQPERRLELSLAANAMLLFLVGIPLFFSSATVGVGRDVLTGGCLLAAAATAVDLAAKRYEKRLRRTATAAQTAAVQPAGSAP